MHFSIKNHHICGESTRKNHQKRTTWWRKIKTWHKIPLLVPTKSSLKRTFTKKTARRSATCANQFVKMIAKKNTPRGGKKQNCECVCTTLCCTVKTPLAQLYQMRPTDNFTRNEKWLLTSGQINGTIVISMR